MNDLTKIEHTQICKPLPKLTSGQRKIYGLIFEACENKEVLSIEKAYQIYKTVGAGQSWDNMRYYDEEKKEWRAGIRIWTEEWWKMNFKIWFINVLGALMFKGCLKVLPAIDFSALQENQEVRAEEQGEAEPQPLTAAL
jgi:hypothetical protein